MRVARRPRPSVRTARQEPWDASSARGGEGGAVLILALVFLIVTGGIVGVLANSISSHLDRLARALQAAQAVRSARKAAGAVRVQMDPLELI